MHCRCSWQFRCRGFGGTPPDMKEGVRGKKKIHYQVFWSHLANHESCCRNCKIPIVVSRPADAQLAIICPLRFFPRKFSHFAECLAEKHLSLGFETMLWWHSWVKCMNKMVFWGLRVSVWGSLFISKKVCFGLVTKDHSDSVMSSWIEFKTW